MNISIIIPNYNGENLLKKNLPRVFEAADYYRKIQKCQVEIIIVDDNSSDNSKEVVQSFLRSRISLRETNINPSTLRQAQGSGQKSKIILTFFKNEKNLGFSSTVNRGVREASGEIVVLLNTDVVPDKGFLDPLLSHFKDEKLFAVGCMDKSIEDGKTILRGRGIGKWQRGFLVHSRGEVDKTNTLWVNGGSGAFRKLLWDKLGGFDELYSPFYWEDIDLSYRAIKSGFKVLFEPKSIVVHEHEKGAIKGAYSTFQIETVAFRNQFIFVWKNVTDIDLLFFHIFWLPYHFVKAFISGEWAFILGFFQALIRFSQVIRSKDRWQKYFTKSDRQVLKEFR